MMNIVQFVCEVGYIFFVVLEVSLFLYIITSWFPIGKKIRQYLLILLEPLFVPIRALLKRSIFKTASFDLSPMIAIIIISYMEQFFRKFK